MAVGPTESASVGPGGDLGAFMTLNNPLGTYGAAGVAGANNLLAAGGLSMGAPSSAILAGTISNANPPVIGAFTPSMQTLGAKRYLPGATVVGPLLILAGGADSGPATATKSTEWMVY